MATDNVGGMTDALPSELRDYAATHGIHTAFGRRLAQIANVVSAIIAERDALRAQVSGNEAWDMEHEALLADRNRLLLQAVADNRSNMEMFGKMRAAECDRDALRQEANRLAEGMVSEGARESLVSARKKLLDKEWRAICGMFIEAERVQKGFREDRDRLSARCEGLEKLLRDCRDNYVEPKLSFERMIFNGHENCSDIPALESDLAAIDAALSPPASDATESTVRTGTVADIADSELLHRAISNLAAKARRQPAWARISDVFALGSTYSAQLCRRFGRDPDTGKTLDTQTEPLAAGVAG